MHRRVTPDIITTTTIRTRHGGGAGGAASASGLAAIVVWAASGIYIVQPNERAVVWRYGRILPERGPPGLHFGLPWGLDRVSRLKLYEQKRVGIGFSLEERNLGRAADPAARNVWRATGT